MLFPGEIKKMKWTDMLNVKWTCKVMCQSCDKCVLKMSIKCDY